MDKTLKYISICLLIVIILLVAFIIQTRYYKKAEYSLEDEQREIEFISGQLENTKQAPTFTPEPTSEKTLKDYSPEYKIAYLQAKYPDICIYKPSRDKVIGTEGSFKVTSFSDTNKIYSLAKGYVSYYKIEERDNLLQPRKILFSSILDEISIEYWDQERNTTLFLVVKDRVYLSTKGWKQLCKNGTKYRYNEIKSEISDKYYTAIRYDWQDKHVLLYINEQLTDELLKRYTNLTKVEFHKDKDSLERGAQKLYSRAALNHVLKKNPNIDYHQYYKHYTYGIFEGIYSKELT
jgi:hypothetical protein